MDTLFFSYSRADQEFAMRLADDIRKNGINVWFDQIDIPKGSLWDIEIEKALKSCDILIVVISSNSVKSNNVLDEISFAIEESKKIIPIKISNCDIPFRIRRLQYVDFTKNYSIGLQTLIASISNSTISVPPARKKTIINLKSVLLSLFIILICYSLYLFISKQIQDGTILSVKNDTIKHANSKNTALNPNTGIPLVSNNPSLKPKSEIQADTIKFYGDEKTVVEKIKGANNSTTNNKVNWKDKYSKIGDYKNELAIVEKISFIESEGNKYSKYTYGIVNIKGNEVVECKYDDIKYNLTQNTLFVKKNNFWGIIDKYGGLITHIIFSEISGPSEGFYKFQSNNGAGFLRLDGTVLASGFGECRNFKEGMAAVSSRSTGQWGYINLNGELAIGYDYEKAEDFSEGTGRVFFTPKYEIKQSVRFVKRDGSYWWPKY